MFPESDRPRAGAEIKVCQLFELKDFGLSDAIERFRDIEARKK